MASRYDRATLIDMIRSRAERLKMTPQAITDLLDSAEMAALLSSATMTSSQQIAAIQDMIDRQTGGQPAPAVATSTRTPGATVDTTPTPTPGATRDPNIGQPPPGWTSGPGDAGDPDLYWRGPNGEVYNPRTQWLRGADGNEEQRTVQEVLTYYGPGGPGAATSGGSALPPGPRGVLTPAQRAQQAALDREAEPRGLKPRIGSLREIMGATTPGQMPEYGRFTGTELERYLPIGSDKGNTAAATNLMRLMGYEPNQGNPNVSFLESLIPRLTRQSDLERRLGGGLALGSSDPELSNEENERVGTEARMQILGDVSGTMGSGATSRFTPQQGLQKLEDLNNRVNSTEPDITGLNVQFGEGGQANAFNAVMDLVGGGLSPTIAANPDLRQRMANRLWEDYQNRGTENGGSFLNFLLGLVRQKAGPPTTTAGAAPQ